ncbi:endonuclease Q family protein [Patescibacteria group bacterium]|nr:endonuclease Q family protein [Patescibacteria group bacterium]
MRFICDFHIHSKYSRATSRQMEPETLAYWAAIKGINVLGAGDFTHPAWVKELKEKLEPAEKGLYKLKDPNFKPKENSEFGVSRQSLEKARFVLTAEISSIYSKAGKVRRAHNVIFAPDFETVEKINSKLEQIGNLKSDGRPILGLDAKELLKIILSVSPAAVMVPAHAWTPWFSVFGSKSGFDSLEECFDDYAKYIFAIETGLSSDPGMNWRLSALDKITLISNSDAHSPANLGREANVFEGESIDYYSIMSALKNKGHSDTTKTAPLKFAYTIEFFPEEGKYHYDGHRLCNVSMGPEETKKAKGVCPVCRKPLTIGVMYRVEELADRPVGGKPERVIPYKNLIPLEEIIADALGLGKISKATRAEYVKLICALGSEFNILLDAPIEEIAKHSEPIIAEGVKRTREQKAKVVPGFDGEYGKIKIFEESEREKFKEEKKERQKLF